MRTSTTNIFAVWLWLQFAKLHFCIANFKRSPLGLWIWFSFAFYSLPNSFVWLVMSQICAILVGFVFRVFWLVFLAKFILFLPKICFVICFFCCACHLSQICRAFMAFITRSNIYFIMALIFNRHMFLLVGFLSA